MRARKRPFDCHDFAVWPLPATGFWGVLSGLRTPRTGSARCFRGLQGRIRGGDLHRQRGVSRLRGEKRDLVDEQTRFGEQAMQLAQQTDELVERLREVSFRSALSHESI